MPAPMAPINWSGPYFGGTFGGSWGKFPGSISVGPTAATTGPGGTAPAAPGGSVPLRGGHSDGVTGGGQIGWQWQWNSIVFGGEGEFKGDGLGRGTTLTPAPGAHDPGAPAVFPFIGGDHFSARQDWDASIRGKIGFAWDRWLLYGTGGWAFSDVKLRANFIPVGIFPAATASQTKNLSGPTYGGGIEYWVAPNVSIAGEYRYTDYGSETYSLGSLATTAATTGGVTTFGRAPVTGKVSLQEHQALLKINFRFAAPPPAPPPVAPPPPPPPAAQQVFLVFFDWDKDKITPAGMDVIRDAVAAWKAGAPVQIQVTGYTDRSGSPGYNQRLSDRRANNVAAAMTGMGVPRNVMEVHGRGENDNRVPTADGVREPQNRRVEIFYLR
ncbi:MAG TPA: OmpA family protein [Stellaceae bacterium]|nr:OmpA family protein [Stellaceae bacterium]